jgi:hypothetical protein
MVCSHRLRAGYATDNLLIEEGGYCAGESIWKSSSNDVFAGGVYSHCNVLVTFPGDYQWSN